MPSPVGHLLAGAAVAWSTDPRADRRLLLTAAVLAALPDLDLLTPLPHRTITHSLVAVAVITIVAAIVTRQVTSRPVMRVAVMCGLAYATHLALDWVSADRSPPRGFQALWPFSEQFYIAGWELFGPTERRQIFSLPTITQNLVTVAREVAILGPIVYGLWLVRVKALARLPAELTRRDHAAQ
jgi:membrane-bound metal-dependent hydrolase YbcI (DUF457 family)